MEKGIITLGREAVVESGTLALKREVVMESLTPALSEKKWWRLKLCSKLGSNDREWDACFKKGSSVGE